jgi:hypothetical protein
MTNLQENYPIVPSGINHSFDEAIANKLGVDEAILYNKILFWLRHNEAMKINFKKGKFWTYMTYDQMLVQLPFFKNKTRIKKAMQVLLEAGLLERGYFNLNPFNRTPWYTLKNSNNVYQESKSLPRKDIEQYPSEESKSLPSNISIKTVDKRTTATEEHAAADFEKKECVVDPGEVERKFEALKLGCVSLREVCSLKEFNIFDLDFFKKQAKRFGLEAVVKQIGQYFLYKSSNQRKGIMNPPGFIISRLKEVQNENYATV